MPIRILAAKDDRCRENLCLLAHTSISDAWVARQLDTLVRLHGKPTNIAIDNRTGFTRRAILKWANDEDVDWPYFDPGKPRQNACIASFNSSFRDETLNEDMFDMPG